MKAKSDKILQWLHTHPLIKIKPLEELINVKEGTIRQALAGRQGLAEKHIEPIKKILKQYGYK